MSHGAGGVLFLSYHDYAIMISSEMPQIPWAFFFLSTQYNDGASLNCHKNCEKILLVCFLFSFLAYSFQNS